MDKTTLETIKLTLEQAAGIAKVLAPQYAAYIVIGQAVATTAPDIFVDVIKMLSKDKPTDEEKADFARKVAALSQPETIT